MKLISFFLMIVTTFLAVHSPVESTAQSRAETALLSTNQKVVDQALSKLNEYAAIQSSLNIQNPDLAYAMRKALVMADLLIKSNGTIDLQMIPLVKSAFISSSPEEYEVNMAKVLGQANSFWPEILAKVTAPKDPSGVGNLAVRALFSLDSPQSIKNRHAKVAVLAAMLAPYNQGPVGDCFAVNDVIRDHEEYFLHAAKDYQSIVMNGFIERPVNGNPDYFLFLPILADDDRDQPFNLTASGMFPGTNYSLFDAPGFAAAQALMGATGVTAEDVIKLLASNVQGDQIQVTPSQVIAAIAQVQAAKMPNTSVDALCTLGEYGFSSLTNNPILRGVEAAFAAMAEDRPNDSTRGNINSCIAQALQSTWDQLRGVFGSAEFQQEFTSSFNASYRLLYNLNIPLPQVSSDGSSMDGGFQLYKRIPGSPSQLGIRVATPQEFKQLVIDAITVAKEQLGSTTGTIGDRVLSVVNTDDFLKSAFWAYDPANQQESDPVNNYQKLARTPMQSCDGDNPYEVDDIDTGIVYDNNVQSYTPSNANDLITWCLNLAKVAPPELIPMDSPQHAFNFVPNNPDISSFIKKNMPVSQWIQNMLVVPGMQVSRRQIDPSTLKSVTDQIYNQISNALPDSAPYQQLVLHLTESKASVRDFANRFLNGVNNLLNSDQNQARQVALVLDGLLLQSLPANDRAILSRSAIRFAFTNWNVGTKDIYFCAFFNPRTEQVGFGTIFEDKTNLQPMDEDAWVNNQEWDVDLKPSAPSNLASHASTR